MSTIRTRPRATKKLRRNSRKLVKPTQCLATSKSESSTILSVRLAPELVLIMAKIHSAEQASTASTFLNSPEQTDSSLNLILEIFSANFLEEVHDDHDAA